MVSNNSSPQGDDKPPTDDPVLLLFSTVESAQRFFRKYRFHFGAALISFLYLYPSSLLWIIASLWRCLLTMLGIGLGIGLGLGLATHVYDQLDQWQTADQVETESDSLRHSTAPPIPKQLPSKRNISSLEDAQTYASRMKAARYYPFESLRRGQVLKSDLPQRYYFNNPTQAMELWGPTLPDKVRKYLGEFMDLVVKDFVGSWYSSMDPSVQYDSVTQDDKDSKLRHWLAKTGPFQKQPFIEEVYSCLGTALGNLATRVEHVNILKVVLLEWVRVLAHTFKWYRHLRKRRKASEMTKEFLLAGKLHQAVVFGLDVPALLFADAEGRECNGNPMPELDLLESRLLETVPECELDYLRTLAHRMTRALLPRSEFESPLVSSLVTEILSGCVLSPMMGCLTPEYINGWLVMGLASDDSTDSLDESDSPQRASNPLDEAPSDSATSPEEEMNDTNDEEPTEDSAATTESDPPQQVTWNPRATGDEDLAAQLTQALGNLQRQLDFTNLPSAPDWQSCQSAIIRVILVIEAAFQHGRCSYREPQEGVLEVEVTLHEFETVSFSQLLMELTADPDTFELPKLPVLGEVEPYACTPTPTEQSTIRTLIAAWLHGGQVSPMFEAVTPALELYFGTSAFLRGPKAEPFRRQLRLLNDIPIVVDTMAVLASPRLAEIRREATQAVSPTASVYSSTTPRHFDFHRNEAFASSLRSERERRRQSWLAICNAQEGKDEGLPLVVCRHMDEEHVAWHRELHHVAKIFYAGTNLISLRDASRKAEDTTVSVGLLTVEVASARRRIEVPDDDSSFLLRAQPRPLNPVGVHRDSRNHDLSFRCFGATMEENGTARYVHRCLIRYFPTDRTATIALQNDSRKLDQRKSKGAVPDTITVGRSGPVLSPDYLRERHLCQRWTPKGTNRTQSLLASSVMETSDFTSMPRSGKALDFVYRMSFFERPMVDLGGKLFTVQDSGTAHRADASALEVSDAALSATLLAIGGEQTMNDSGPSLRLPVEMGSDGYPIVWMKFSRKHEEGQVEVKPYRLSFVRAALLLTSTRAEAQLQSLIRCVQAGSAKRATKTLTDTYLRPTLRLVEYAGHSSREKQSILLRDLKLGGNHIDRTQLRRNGLLLPRYPTRLLDLSATIEGAAEASDVKNVELFGTTGIVYKIRLSAMVDLIVEEDELEVAEAYRAPDGNLGKIFREEWVVYRSFKEFQAVHKHLKTQVSPFESSGTAGSRLVGAASAAFTTHGASINGRTRTQKVLIPSMSQATKVGALGISKKSVDKRREHLNEYLQYLLSPGHLLSRCPELMLFLGAFYPLLPQVMVGQVISGIPDPLGRTEMSRTILETFVSEEKKDHDHDDHVVLSPRTRSSRTQSLDDMEEEVFDDDEDMDPSKKKKIKKVDMIPAIRNKIDKVPLSQVRNRLFELLKYQFGFENASFARNRMLAAIKTASFAVTSGSEFRRMLYTIHRSHLSTDAIADWIKFGIDLLWPNGAFFESSPPLTEDELGAQARNAKQALHQAFPEALQAILGNELTHDGLEIFFELLQNRTVVKSMAYMLFDLLWLEVFPEIGDILQCGTALDIDP